MFFKLIIVGTLLVAATSFEQNENIVEINPFIVNGTDAVIEEFPFLVALRRNARLSCAGSLLNEYWILTAAHCLFNTSPDQFTIEYATTKQVQGVNGTNIAFVEQNIIHEGYEPRTLRNDIALMKLKTPINTGLFDTFVKLAPKGNYWKTGTPTTAAGWGRTGSNEPISEILQKVDMQIYSYADCYAAHDDFVYRTNICAGVPEMGKAECNGDSGGPLLVNGVQVGVVSWSVKPCAIAPFPGVYTDVTYFIDWIQQTTGIDFQMNMFLTKHN